MLQNGVNVKNVILTNSTLFDIIKSSTKGDVYGKRNC